MIDIVLQKMIEYNAGDIKRINHALKVYGFAKAIANEQELSDKEQASLEIAAVLHDIGIKEAVKKYSSSAGHYQEKEGPIAAGNLIGNMGIDNAVLNRVYHLIGNHHSYSEIDGIDFQILVEADFLVNIYEGGIKETGVIREKYFKTRAGISILKSMYE